MRRGIVGKKNGHRCEGKSTNRREKWPIGAL